MKKEDIASAIIYLIMVGAAVVVGTTVVADTMQHLYPAAFMNEYLFSILAIIVGIIFNVIFLEVLHAIGGKMGGYNVVSINFLGFCFEKKMNKWIFHFKDFDGLTGETKLSPKKENAKLNAFIYMPLVGYAAEVALGIVVYSLAQQPDSSDFVKICATGGLLFIVIASMIALYNIVPIKLDSMSDGYRMMLISKKENVEALNELMRIENCQREGVEVGDVKIFNQITDFTANINLFAVYECLKSGNYEEAHKLIDMIIVDPTKIEDETYNRLLAQKLYIYLIADNKEEATKLYNETLKDANRRFIANDISMESLRAYILIAGLIEESRGEIEFIKNRKAKAMKRALPSRADLEEKLFNDALDKVYKIHPNWLEENN